MESPIVGISGNFIAQAGLDIAATSKWNHLPGRLTLTDQDISTTLNCMRVRKEVTDKWSIQGRSFVVVNHVGRKAPT